MMRHFIFFISLLLSVFLPTVGQAKGTSQLRTVRMSATAKHLRIVLTLTRSTYYKISTLHSPERVVVDLRRTQLKQNLKKIKKPSVIKRIRSGKLKNRGVRLVFEFKTKIRRVHDHFLKATRSRAPRIVIDATIKPVKRKTTHWTKKPVQATATYFRKVIVVLDPGHGGHDPGASGQRGTHEKTVVLAIAKKLQTLINKEPGMEAVLTRRHDVYLGLRQRLRIARRLKGDLFISIHADAFRNKRANGVSVYALSHRGASSEAARWLAEKENRSAELIGGIDLDERSVMLRTVLLDLSQTATKQASQLVGELVLQSLGQVARRHYRKVERAGFVVLKSPDIPSILIETGFISNLKEARKLKSARYQRRLATAMLSGIRRYFVIKPPAESWFAWRRQASQYKIVRGDNLSVIARRFDTSIATIKASNHLLGNTLKIGQTLLIPRAARL